MKAVAMDMQLRYVMQDVDRHGNVRTYFRRRGHPKIRLPEIGSAEFMTAYAAALGGPGVKRQPAAAEGTFRALCIRYFASPQFDRLDASTKLWRRRSLDDVCRKRGDLPVALMTTKGLNQLKQEWAAQPGAANNRIKAIKALCSWAIGAGLMDTNPTRDMALIRYSSEGHHSWEPDEVAAFEDRHPVGTRARLAMALMLFTACRREDAVRLGPQHIKKGRLIYIQAKNEHRKPVKVNIPLHSSLATIIAATPSGHLTFLATQYGKPFTVAGFGNWFRDRCNEAGLPQCSAHGLRKAAATRLAEAGASAHEIMSVTGHRSLAEVERYTQAARWSGLADSAMEKAAAAATGTDSVPPRN